MPRWFRPLLVLAALLVACPARPAPAQVGALRVDSPSPTAASLGKFGDLPVSLYTGTPTISLPLHTVRGRSLSVPITVSYHASGVKVREIAGWAGIGWALNAGGVITRTVHGLPDDGAHGYPATGGQITEAVWSAADNDRVVGFLDSDEQPSQAFIDYKQDVIDQEADPEPDQFFFSFNGRSGQFFFTAGGAVRAVPHQALKIVPDAPETLTPFSSPTQFTGIPGWTITAEDGTVYRFGSLGPTEAREYTHRLESDCDQCALVSSWYLLAITSATGDETITFTYAPPVAITRDRPAYKELVSHAGAVCDGGLNSPTLIDTRERLDTIFLASITSDFETVSLLSEPRGGAYAEPDERRLHRIEVADGTATQRRAFDFVHTPRYSGRLFLDRIDERGVGDAFLSDYTFHYYDGALPPFASLDTDHWGYHNDANNQTDEAIPDAYFDLSTQAFYFGGAYKGPGTLEAMRAGTLRRLTYPTKGFTEFTYEPHDYGHVGPDPVAFAFGPPQALEVDCPEPVCAPQALSLGDTYNAGAIPVEFMLRWPADIGDNDCLGTPCARLRVLDDEGAEIADFTEPPAVGMVSREHLLLPDSATYTLVAEVEDGFWLSADVAWRLRVAASQRPGGGLRIAAITSDDGRGTTTTKTFAYEHEWAGGMRSSGVLIADPQYFYVLQLEIEGAPCYQLHRSVHPVAGLGLTQGSPIGYARVVVRNGAGNGYTEHRFSTALDPEHGDGDLDDTPLEARYIWGPARRTSRDFKRGHGQVSTPFSQDDAAITASHQTVVHFDGEPDAGPLSATTRAIVLKTFPALYFSRYEVISAWSFVETETVTTYDPDGPATTTLTRTFAYDDPQHLQPTEQTETDEDGRQRTTRYVYAHEHEPGMASAHMLAQPYRTTVLEGNTIAAREWTTWAHVQGGWRPHETWTWTGGNAPDEPGGPSTIRTTRFDAYDALGRVTTQHDALDRPTSFTYGQPDGTPDADGLFLVGVAREDLSIGYRYHTATGRWGLLEQLLDENGDATTYTYDDFGRLHTLSSPRGEVARYAYHLSSGDVGTDPSHVETTTVLAPNHEVVSTEFLDGLGRPFLTQLATSDAYILAQTKYDDRGLPFEVWKPYLSTAPGTYGESAARNYYAGHGCPYTRTTYLADPLGRPDRVYPDGEICGAGAHVRQRYGVASADGTPRAYAETTDEEGHVARAYADGFGQQVRAEAAVGSPAESTTAFLYDIRGQLVEVRPPNHFDPPSAGDWTTTYTYDGRGLLLTRNTPDATASSDDFRYAYDAQGNLRFTEDPNREGTGYLYTDYDAFDRPTEMGRCDAPFPTAPGAPTCDVAARSERVVYLYDDFDGAEVPVGVCQDNLAGRLAQVSFEGGYYQYCYDDDGTVREFFVHLDALDGPGAGRLVRYTYDRQGSLTEMAYQPDAPAERAVFTYLYDGAGRLEEVQSQVSDETAKTVEARYTYRATGQIETLQLGPPGVLPPIDYAYHIRDWLTHINDPGGGTEEPFEMQLGYDENVAGGAQTYRNGNVSSVRWSGLDEGGVLRPAVGFSFIYDVHSRLTGAPFDDFGAGGPSYTLASLSYDANGNVVLLDRHDPALPPGSDTAIAYAYTPGSNRLASVAGAATATFAYDANGNMTRTRTSDPAEAIVYDRRNLPTEIPLPGGASLTFAYDAEGQRIAKTLHPAPGDGDPVTTIYVRGAGGAVLAVYEDAGAGPLLRFWNLLAGGQPLGRIQPESEGTN